MSITTWIDSHITLHDFDNLKEERANAATHFVGILLAIGAIIWVLRIGGGLSSPRLATGLIVYALSMLLLYSASTLYHFLPRNTLKKFCRILDHANIYFLIAGTYTPILLYIDSSPALLMLFLLWCITIVGTTLTIIFWGKFKVLHVLLYIVMGWSLVFFWKDIIPFIPKGLFAWILAGGITYTVGTIFYAIKKMPYYHAVWHLFVLGGTACHFIGFTLFLK